MPKVVGWLDNNWSNCRLQRTLTFWVNETFFNSFLHNDMSNDLTKPKQVQNEVFNFSENKMEIIVFSQILFHFYWTNNSVLSFHQVSLLHFLPTFLTMLNSAQFWEGSRKDFLSLGAKYGIVKWPHLKYIAITDPSCICLLGFVSLQLLLAAGNFLDKKEGKKKEEENKLTYFLEHLKFVLFSARLALWSFQTSNVYLSEDKKYALNWATFFSIFYKWQFSHSKELKRR